MAAPAYRYDSAEVQPQYRGTPHVHAVPARGIVEGLDPRYFVIVRVVVAIALIFAVAGFARVWLNDVAVAASIEYEQVEADINTARAEGSMLEVQASNLSNPAYVKDYAQQKLGMIAPDKVETMALGQDVVALDENGALSLSQSLAAIARG